MKRLILVIYLLFAWLLSSFGQEFQRIQIDASQLNNITIKGNGALDLHGKCLDEFRHPPLEATHINHVLTESSNIMVEFLDDGHKTLCKIFRYTLKSRSVIKHCSFNVRLNQATA